MALPWQIIVPEHRSIACPSASAPLSPAWLPINGGRAGKNVYDEVLQRFFVENCGLHAGYLEELKEFHSLVRSTS